MTTGLPQEVWSWTVFIALMASRVGLIGFAFVVAAAGRRVRPSMLWPQLAVLLACIAQIAWAAAARWDDLLWTELPIAVPC